MRKNKKQKSIGLEKKSSQTSPFKTLCEEFGTILQIKHIKFDKDPNFVDRCESLADYLSHHQLLPLAERKRGFLGHINWKFRINAKHLAVFYEQGAKLGKTFNYHQKCAIQLAFDRSEVDKLPDLLGSFDVEASILEELMRCANCATIDDTRKFLYVELESPSKLRITSCTRDIELEILQSLFASFLWVSLPQREMHRFFDIDFNEENYHESFWEELQQRTPKLFHRDEALHFLIITEKCCKQFDSVESLRENVLSYVSNSYQQINNYGFLVVLLQSIELSGKDVSWELAADIILFGEKHIEQPLDRAYFRHERISATTLAYIPNIDTHKARFDLANEGFTYRDCFILTSQQSQKIEQLLVFQKNHRDETIIPCPTCRSSEVEGNSYPSLGVKSWECCNPLCPDRSKYNRGKRYSFRGLAMQQAIDDERNNIAPKFVGNWRRDIVKISSYDEVLEMVIRHYSIWGDRIRCFGDLLNQPGELLGRVLRWEKLSLQQESSVKDWFKNAAFFNRYGVISAKEILTGVELQNLGDDRLKVFCGDSRHILSAFQKDSLDGAITSPPYYNAREYSQWENIYCYLQDMFEVNIQVFRVLKPGALYFYNVFDYFDNENITALSAMGNKRIPLSAYTVDLFRRIGFNCIGNIVWDKGEIEGKRGYNAGNFSPFYQSPFNCWEHILVFRKPGNNNCDFRSGRLRAKPVLKMVKGKNQHGHTAPFPEDIPLLCIQAQPLNSVILDPFGGSLTTGRVAVSLGRSAICIEQSKEYCQLGLNLYQKSINHNYLQQQLAL